MVFTTPTIRGLRERFPDAHLTYLVEPPAAPVVEHNSRLDEVIVVHRVRGLAGLRRDVTLGLRLSRARFDIAIDYHGGPRASFFTWMSGAPMRIGYAVAARSWMYTHRVPRARELRPRHSVENQWDLLAPLGFARPDPERFPVEMVTDERSAARVRERLNAQGVGPACSVILMHVSAGNPFRRWPLESFATVAASLVTSDSQRRVILTSGPSEGGARAQVIAEARKRAGISGGQRILDCGEFSLQELRILVDLAAVYIGGDSGPLHIAATSRVPIVGLFGPTLPVRSQPWRPDSMLTASIEVAGLPCRPCDQRRCEPGDFRCLTWIAPQQVVEAAERLLQRRQTAEPAVSQRITVAR